MTDQKDKVRLLEWVKQTFSKKTDQQSKAELNKDVDLSTKLFNAVLLGTDEDIQKLLEIGADPTFENKQGLNAIQMAKVHRRSHEVIELMASHNLEASSKKKRKLKT